jgi:hypothetical protein
MKKTLISISVLAAFLTSCRKDFTCECTNTNSFVSTHPNADAEEPETSTTTTTYKKVKRNSDMKDICVYHSSSYIEESNGTDNTGKPIEFTDTYTYTQDCKIK